MRLRNLQGSISDFSARSDEWEKLYKRDGKRYGENHNIFCELARPYLGNCKRVLELGCGYGRDLLYLAKLYPTVNFLGIDSSATAVSILLHDAKRKELENLRAITENWLGFPYDKFMCQPIDGIISHFFMHLFLEQEREEILKRSAHILQYNGTLINSLISISDSKFTIGKEIEQGTFACYPDRPWHFLHFWGEEEIRKIYSSTGFEVDFMCEYIEKEEILNKVEETGAWFVVSRKVKG